MFPTTDNCNPSRELGFFSKESEDWAEEPEDGVL